MTLTVEDNTGLSNADSYLPLADFKTYCTLRGVDYSLLVLGDGTGDDTTLENLLRVGFAYINNNWVYKSWPTSNLQAGEFPRQQLSDGAGRIFNNIVPQRVKDAQCEAAIARGQGTDLFVVAARGGMVVDESVGPIRTTYAPTAPAENLFQSVSRMIGVFVKDPNSPRRMLPYFNDYGGPDVDPGPQFSVGMDDNTDGSTPNSGGVLN